MGTGIAGTNPGAMITNTGFIDYITDNGSNGPYIVNQGTVRVRGSGSINWLAGGAFTNATSGLFDIQTDVTFTANGGGGASFDFKNAGIFRKSAGSITIIPNGYTYELLAGGRIQANAGTLNFTPAQLNTFDGALLSAVPGATFNFGPAAAHITGVLSAPSNSAIIHFTLGNFFPNADGVTPGSLAFSAGVAEVDGSVFNGALLSNTGTLAYVGPGNQIGTFTNNGVMTFDGSAISAAGQPVLGVGGIWNFLNDTAFNVAFQTIQNAGLIEKTGGSGALSLSNAGINNTGTILALSGSIALNNASISGADAHTLPSGGTYEAGAGASIDFGSNYTLTTNNGIIRLSGPGATIPQASSLTTNNGTFAVQGGATYSTTGSFTNTGTLSVGGNFTVNGDLTLATASSTLPTLELDVSGLPGQPGAPNLIVTGTTTLTGNLTATTTGGFAPPAGTAYPAASFTASTGAFTATDGVGPGFTATITPTTITLNASATGAGSDLIAASVSIPASGSVASPITVNFGVRNASGLTASGTWTDSLYLSTDGTLDPSDILLGRKDHAGSLAAGSSYSDNITATFPSLIDGTYHVILVTDSGTAVSDTNRANNTLASTATLTVTIPALTLGAPIGSTIAAGQEALYRLVVPGGQDVRITQTSTIPAIVDVEVSRGVLPTFDSAQFLITPDATITSNSFTIPHPQAGVYYVRLIGRPEAGAGSNFTLTAAAISFGAFSASPANVAAATSTIIIDGAGFTSASVVQLLSGGATIATATVTQLSAERLSATFNLSSAAPGLYDLQVTDGANHATLAGAITVQAATTAAPVEYQMIAPGVIRPLRTNVMYVKYTNPNGFDVPAPFFELFEPNISFRLAGGDVGANIGAGSFTSGYLDLFAINQQGLANILPAHYTGQFRIEFKTLISAGDTEFGPSLGVPANPNDPRALFDLSSLITPGVAGISSATVQILAAELQGLSALPTDPHSAGGTGYSFTPNLQVPSSAVMDRLLQTAATLSTADVHEADITRLLSYQLNQADAFGAVTTRQQTGPFGQGAPDILHYSITKFGNAVQFTSPDGVRTFDPLGGGAYAAENPLDTGVLSKLADGTFRLTETTGTFYQFDAAGRLNFLQDVAGVRTTFAYDGAGRVVSITRPTIALQHMPITRRLALSAVPPIATASPASMAIASTRDRSARPSPFSQPLQRLAE